MLLFFLRRLVLRRRMPLIASFKVTHHCNLACAPCPFHRLPPSRKGHMDCDTARKALTTLRGTGVPIVVFEGGEPLLWRDGDYTIRELMDYARGLFPVVAVTTNGTQPLDVPADRLWVSIDGLKETHDRLRSASFDTVWSHIVSCGRPFMVHFTVNRINRRDIGPLLERLREVRGFGGMTVQFFYPYGGGEEDLTLSSFERGAVVEEVAALKARGFPILNSQGRLRAMVENTWKCRDDILVNVDPDGTVTEGCYARRRGRIDCRACGFTPVAEASAAVALHPGSLRAGWSIFLAHR
ncbi:MAG TPA: radical SAM protein [Syntrophales bacterium]|nr:radical SAM protein [Syntrophales bacterium]HRS87686.1 radical SAM protein [Syntrophales bacterium]